MNTQADNRQQAIALLEQIMVATRNMTVPASISITDEFGRNPFLILISCVLSLRTKDTTSLPASRRLFLLAQTPAQLQALSIEQIEKVIYPVGFYRVKARTLIAISTMLEEQFGGKVPSDEASLLSLPGVGRKTMNLVRAEGFELPALCVDVHVHRIANRLGIVHTKKPEQTEMALRGLLPPEWWRECNRLFVMWGQNICVPQRPWCSKCPVFDLCQRVNVVTSR